MQSGRFLGRLLASVMKFGLPMIFVDAVAISPTDAVVHKKIGSGATRLVT